MRVRYSKRFEKSVRQLSGKALKSVTDAIREVKQAQDISDTAHFADLGNKTFSL